MAVNDICRQKIQVQGQVQGVGFRPFVWRLAREMKLAGFVRNTSHGVLIEIQGKARDLAEFGQRLEKEAPPLARIDSISSRFIAICSEETALADTYKDAFRIAPSEKLEHQKAFIGPDTAICKDCLSEIMAESGRRAGYAFTNCTNCGPRFTIAKTLPYDRPQTAMACFPMCPECAREYQNPADRRFHAQPVACPHCGPGVWLVDGRDVSLGRTEAREDKNAIASAGKALMSGKILALKGLGGFQLVCDAANSQAVANLRQRKNRPHKAFALMAANLESVERYCQLSPAMRTMLTGAEKPIVLCPKRRDGADVFENIAPDCDQLGFMLPYTPLHALLFAWLSQNGSGETILVMTSGNAGGEPICIGNREALERLQGIADCWLLHDRDILSRVDDSVCAIQEEKPQLFRRARGWTPGAIHLTGNGDGCILGVGAELKAAFCLTRDQDAFIGQHIGDLQGLTNMDFYREALLHMERLLEVRPDLVVHDCHPDFLSTAFARELGERVNIPVIALQHHAAHAAAVLAEAGQEGSALALCLDGAGYGLDGSVWGGELILMDLSQPYWQRVGSFREFLLPGGDAAARQPWRIGRALQHASGRKENWPDISEKALQAVDEMLGRRLNCPATSSCGRLFDGLSALLGFCGEITYEGQAAIRLEKAARDWLAVNKPVFVDVAPLYHDGEIDRLDCITLAAEIYDRFLNGLDAGACACAFHHALAFGLANLCEIVAKKHGIKTVALGGGVLQNGLLAGLVMKNLRSRGLEPFLPRLAPAGDGCIGFGQAVWGRALRRNLK